MINSISRPILVSGILSLLIAVLGLGWYFYSQRNAAQLDPFWNQYDSQSTATVDHQQWQQLLDDFLVADSSGINLMDYEGLQYDGLESLNNYVNTLASIDPRTLNRSEKMSYWINLYNALTVKVITEAYPVASILETGQSVINKGPWDDQLITVVGKKLTLNDIEHRILRPVFDDYRIHFAVNCASIGCPNLSSRMFQGAQLDAMLDQASTEFLQHPRAISIHGDRMHLSSLFSWYSGDFGEDLDSVIATLSKHLPKELAEPVRDFDGNVTYEYDWSINAL